MVASRNEDGLVSMISVLNDFHSGMVVCPKWQGQVRNAISVIQAHKLIKYTEAINATSKDNPRSTRRQ